MYDGGYPKQEDSLEVNENIPYPMYRQKRRVSAIGWSITLLLLVPQLLPVLVFRALSFVFPSIQMDVTGYNAVFYLLLYGVSLPLVLLLLGPHQADVLPKQKLSLPKWMLLLVISLGVLYGGAYFTNIVMMIVEQMTNMSNQLDTVFHSVPLPMLALFTLVIAPLGEEFIFRKLLIDRLYRYGTVVSVGLSALLFALFHLNPYQMLYAFLLGLVFGYIYEKTGYLRYTILLHFAANAFGGILPTLFQMLLGDVDLLAPVFQHIHQVEGLLLLMVFSLISMGCVVVSGVLLAVFFFQKQIRIDAGTEPITKRQKAKIVFANPGMIVAFVAIAVLTVWSITSML